jgi:hypothetical protein
MEWNARQLGFGLHKHSLIHIQTFYRVEILEVDEMSAGTAAYIQKRTAIWDSIRLDQLVEPQ